MDDPNPHGPVLMDLTTNPVTITGVPGLGDPATRDQSASVLLPPAQDQRVMILGGGPADASNATGSTAIVDLRSANPVYAPAAPMSLPRMHLNAVLLPDHTVFVSGGALSREDRVVARLQSEIYDPATSTWRIGATASVVRMYHSIALLLPDGRVVTAGGNPPPYGHQVPWEPPDPNEEMRLEVYSPPYLFAGPRPVVSAAPAEWKYGQTHHDQQPAGREHQMGQHHPPRRHHPLLRQLPAARRPGYQRPGRRTDQGRHPDQMPPSRRPAGTCSSSSTTPACPPSQPGSTSRHEPSRRGRGRSCPRRPRLGGLAHSWVVTALTSV